MLPTDFSSSCENFAISLRDVRTRKELASSNLIPSIACSLHAFILPLSLISSVPQACDGNFDSFSGESLPCVSECNSWRVEDIVTCAKDSCRILRNFCVGCEEAQDRVRTSRCLDMLMSLLRICCSHQMKTTCSFDSLHMLHRTCLQAIGNSVASHAENAKAVWALGWPSSLLSIITDDFTMDLKIVALMIVYNCLLQLPLHLREFGNSEECALIIEQFLLIIYRTSPGPLSEGELKNLQDATEWAELLLKLLVTNGYFVPVHQRISVRRHGLQGESSETLLLYLIEDLVKEGMDDSSTSKSGFKISESDCGYIAHEFSLILAICKESALRSNQLQDSSSLKLMSRLMQFIELIATVATDSGSGIRRAMREKGLLAHVVELLKAVLAATPSTSTKLAHAAAPDLKGLHADSCPHPWQERGLKRDLVRVIANMCYQDRASQDAVRELGGIPLVLSCTCIDENNPYSREWGIVAIRNLCENNLENQQVIAALQPQGIASLPSELTSKGIGAQLDDAGRVKLTRARAEDQTAAMAGDAVRAGHVLPSVCEEEPAHAPGSGRPSPAPRATAQHGPAPPAQQEGPERAPEPPPATAATCEDQGMLAELRDMGLHVQVDPDTGLVDICHPQARPAKFSYD